MKLGITSRAVESISRRMGDEEGNEELFISHGRIIEVENGGSTPSVCKLFALSVIYGVLMADMMAQYVDVTQIPRYQRSLGPTIDPSHQHRGRGGQSLDYLPIPFDSPYQVDQTNLLSRMVEVWGEIPVSLLQDLNIRSMQYGFIGLGDYTMYPRLRPGSFIQFDERQRKVSRGSGRMSSSGPSTS